MARQFQIVDLAVIQDRQRHGPARPLALSIEQRPVVFDQALQGLPGQVQSIEIRIASLELGDDPQRLGVVVKAAIRLQHVVECIFAGMTKGRVAEIMHKGDAFRQVLIDAQRTGQRTGHLRHLDRMGQPRAIVVAIRADEHLRLVLQAAKCGGMYDAVAVALELGTVALLVSGNRRPRDVQGSLA